MPRVPNPRPRPGISALGSRFDLLTQQYDSDLARLEMVYEAGNLLGYFSPETCPFCGASPSTST